MKKANGTRNAGVILRIEKLAEQIAGLGCVVRENFVSVSGSTYPIYSLRLGNSEKKVPTLVFVGGVHGLEVIGTEVILAHLETIRTFFEWDQTTREQLRSVKLIFYPCVNPGGMVLYQRSNPNGIDLMRNAPIEAEGVSRLFLPGGHRLSNRLPWYRGRASEPMELENQTLLDFLRKEVWDSPFAITLDVHSGFGMRDRLWFPFAYSKKPFPHVAEALALKKMLDGAFPHNVYAFEPQSLAYRTHGDFWDYAYLLHRQERPGHTFLPLSLEMGSWAWIRKNPRQLFNILGVFNPLVEHRHQRILRRHTILFDFLLRAVYSSSQWANWTEQQRQRLHLEAETLWF